MEYITTAEAARRLSVSKKTIYRRIADGSIPACYLTKKTVRIKESDLDAYMASKAEIMIISELRSLCTTLKIPKEDFLKKLEALL